MQALINRYKAPTPSWAQKTEAGMFLAGNFITGNALLSAHPVIGLVGVGLTLGSKLMNLFTGDNQSASCK